MMDLNAELCNRKLATDGTDGLMAGSRVALRTISNTTASVFLLFFRAKGLQIKDLGFGVDLCVV